MSSAADQLTQIDLAFCSAALLAFILLGLSTAALGAVAFRRRAFPLAGACGLGLLCAVLVPLIAWHGADVDLARFGAESMAPIALMPAVRAGALLATGATAINVTAAFALLARARQTPGS